MERFDAWRDTVIATVTQAGLKILGAIMLYLVGRWLISAVVGLMTRALRRQTIDPTLINFLGSAVAVLLNIALVVAILGYFGVETTTFAALVAAIGIAIGAA